MGGLAAVAGSSLNRLKALDSLPTLEAQLDEARQLCTHRVRAGMILKWIVGKLKTNAKIAVAPDLWALFISASRLVSPEQLGNILTSFDLFTSMQTGLTEAENVEELFDVLETLLCLLRDISESAHGASVRAALSVEAPRIAAFIGTWFQALVESTTPLERLLEDLSSFAETVMQIWAMRKRSITESEIFAEQCLVPALRILSMQRNKSTLEPHSGTKRKHGSGGSVQVDGLARIESEVSRQIILPGRATFLQQKDHPHRAEWQNAGPTASPAGIKHLLTPLKDSMARSDLYERRKLMPCISVVLDIALRTNPMDTPKQRMQERPWIEALWRELFDIILDRPGDTLDERTVIDMLSIIFKRGSLPQDLLAEIVEKFGGLSQETDINWDLLAGVIKIDANIFTMPQAVEPVFKAITSYVLAAKGTAWNEQFTMLKNSIAVPIMNAFAQVRNLTSFIDLWEGQLVQDKHNELRSIWTEFDEEFASLVEEYLTDDQIIEIFGRLHTSFDSALRNEFGSEPPPKLGASIIVMNALLRGIHSEVILDKLQPGLEQLVMSLHAATPHEVSPLEELRSWALTTTSFRLWFPVWVSQQSDADVVSERGKTFLSSPTTLAALAFANAAASDGKANAVNTDFFARAARDAEYLVSCVCHHLHNYPQLKSACVERVAQLTAHLDCNHMQALLQYPDLLSLLSDQAQKALVAKIIAAACESSKAAEDGACALICAAAANGQNHIIDHLIIVALERIKASASVEGGESLDILLRIMISIPASSIGRPLRETILNVVCSVFAESKPSWREEQLQYCLALMIGLMDLPNPSSKLSTDTTIVHNLAARLNGNTGEAADAKSRYVTLALFREIVRLTLKHLMATQEQERSREMLVSLSQAGRDAAGLYVSQKQPASQNGFLMLSLAVIEGLESGCKEDLKSKLPHRDHKWAKRSLPKSIGTLIEKLTELEPTASVSHEAREEMLGLSTMLSIVNLVRKAGGKDVDVGSIFSYVRHALAAAKEICQTVSEGDQTPHVWASRHALVQCYTTACQFAPATVATEDVGLAEDLLELQVDPVEHGSVLSAFKHCVEQYDNTSVIRLAKQFIPEHGAFTRSGLLLLPICMTALNKDAYDENHDTVIDTVLHRLISSASQTADRLIFQRSMQSIATILKEKPFLANQHSIETVLIHLPKLARNTSGPSSAYTLSCEIFSILFLTHRARLQGRYHLLVRALQQLLSQLFRSTDYSARLHRQHHTTHLKAAHAHAFSRLLTLFCEPPQHRGRRRAGGNVSALDDTGNFPPPLVDEFRKEQAHAGQHVPVVLHQFCTQVLHGTLGEGMREALQPGLWAMVEAMEMNGAEGVKVLSAAMENNERAVLRGVVEEWRRMGKWRGG